MENSTPVSASTARLSTIYALLDAEGNVRYVGITVNSLKMRLRNHINYARIGWQTHCARWIRSMDVPPTILEIEQTADRSREKYWIAEYRRQGCALTNITEGSEGGDGTVGYKHKTKCKDETRAKRSAISKAWFSDPAHRAAASETSKKQFEDTAQREKISAVIRKQYESGREPWNKGKPISEELRAKLSEVAHARTVPHGMLGKTHSEQTRKKLSNTAKGRVVTDATRLKISTSSKGKPKSAAAHSNMCQAWVRRREKQAAKDGQEHFDFDD